MLVFYKKLFCDFFYHSKLQVFAGLDGFFGQFFVNFLSFFEAKLEFLAGLGGLFE